MSSKNRDHFYVLDTSALLTDVSSLTVYRNNTVVISVSVLVELDKHKSRLDHVGKNARDVHKLLYDLGQEGNFLDGVKHVGSNVTIQFVIEDARDIPEGLNPVEVDNRIIGTCIGLLKKIPENKLHLVTNDYNLSLKAKAFGIKCEDYRGQVLPVFAYKGYRELISDSNSIDKLYSEGKLKVAKSRKFVENEYCCIKDRSSKKSVLCRYNTDLSAPEGRNGFLHKIKSDIRSYSVKPRNMEQTYLMDLLYDPSISLVTVTGPAGTGKAQPLDSLVLTPEGFVQMGSITVGSQVVTPTGNVSSVLAVYPQGEKATYTVELDGGISAESCGEHLWLVEERGAVELVTLNSIIERGASVKIPVLTPESNDITFRAVVSITPAGVKECQCILIEDEEHLYITNNYIITHNTLVSIACGLDQTVESDHRYNKLIISRSLTVLSGKDHIGYLKGSLDEKLAPYVLPLKDAVDYVLGGPDKKSWDYLKNSKKVLEVEPLQYIRGRSIPNAYFIVDEAQNLTIQDAKTIITRMGEGSKLILLGDLDQIDNYYVNKETNGLAQVIEKFKGSKLAGHVELQKGCRSALATAAAKLL